MTKTETTNFDNEMKALSQGVYKGNEKSIPKDWIKVSVCRLGFLPQQ